MEKNYLLEIWIRKYPLPNNATFIKKKLQKEVYRDICVMLTHPYGLDPQEVLRSPDYKNGDVTVGYVGTKTDCESELAKLRQSFGLPGAQKITALVQRLLKKRAKVNTDSLTKFDKVMQVLAHINILVAYDIHEVEKSNSERTGVHDTAKPAEK